MTQPTQPAGLPHVTTLANVALPLKQGRKAKSKPAPPPPAK